MILNLGCSFKFPKRLSQNTYVRPHTKYISTEYDPKYNENGECSLGPEVTKVSRTD